MELIAAGLADQADDARAAALIGGRSVLGFDAVLIHAILWNLKRRDDGCGIILGNPSGLPSSM